MKRLTAIIILFIILAVGGIIWWENGLLPVNSKDATKNIFVVEKGSGLKEVASKLEAQGLIKNRIVFFLYTRLGKFEGKIQAGDFRLSPSMNLKEIAENLTHGTLDIWVTIPEGKRSDEIADILQEKIPSFKPSWRTILRTQEGYLFPDTYLIPKDATINQITNIMKNNFYAKIQSINLPSNDPRITKITIMASLIEREALRDDEKPIIASVITNRLNVGMSLDIDATLQYIKGKSSGQWWSVPTIEDKKINSEYNTYMNVGLPPAPIANPGLEAIKAALNPQKTNYYYYIHDLEGNVHFAKTLEEHNANIRKYGL
ncbi:MAG: endolytic transglycosylase MltG [Candidatus Levybacteria bacterium]|nr:endolytic transglycosylase MltG [Candidatus Levybacteria bacterium]